jgi:hypothetical protein
MSYLSEDLPKGISIWQVGEVVGDMSQHDPNLTQGSRDPSEVR